MATKQNKNGQAILVINQEGPTSAQAKRLNGQGLFPVLSGKDTLVIFEGYEMFKQEIVDDQYRIKSTNSDPEFAIPCVVVRENGHKEYWEILTSAYAGKQYTIDSKCELLISEEKKTKYAATYKLTKAETRGFYLDIPEGTNVFPTTKLIQASGSMVQCYMVPFITKYMAKDEKTGKWHIKDAFKDKDSFDLAAIKTPFLVENAKALSPKKLEEVKAFFHEKYQKRYEKVKENTLKIKG